MNDNVLDDIMRKSQSAARAAKIAELEYEIALFMATSAMIVECKKSETFALAMQGTDYDHAHKVISQLIRDHDKRELEKDMESPSPATVEEILPRFKVVASDGSLVDAGRKK